MQNNLNMLLSSFALLLLSVSGMAQATPKPRPAPKEEISVKLTSPDKPFRLSIGLTEGNIKVITYSGKEIVVEAELNADKKKPAPNANQNTNTNSNTNINTNVPGLRPKKETSFTGRYVAVTQTDNAVGIGPVKPFSNINVTIKVPANTVKLNLSIAQGGDISVKDVKGEAEIMNPNGSIVLTNISGSVIATSINGNITVSFASVTEKAPMAFSTLVGKIDVTFPATFKANMKMQSDDGTLFSDYDMLFDGAAAKMNKVNTPTLYRTNISGKLSGRVNGGGAEILMKNMNGNIYIRKQK